MGADTTCDKPEIICSAIVDALTGSFMHTQWLSLHNNIATYLLHSQLAAMF